MSKKAVGSEYTPLWGLSYSGLFLFPLGSWHTILVRLSLIVPATWFPGEHMTLAF